MNGSLRVNSEQYIIVSKIGSIENSIFEQNERYTIQIIIINSSRPNPG